ncbi:MAG: VWA domain-containing protein [Desulfobacteraceae bacterium]|nr:VWA domain-containing protein [Desulfobacteraceae bacterium]
MEYQCTKTHRMGRAMRLIPILMLVLWTNVPAAAEKSETQAFFQTDFQSESPAVEVVFVLDTTGSMGGLIAAAKEKIWSIANTLASAEVAPAIKMGLVGYRDRGDAYVTTLTALSDDLDAVYTRLMEFQAGGGGDTPESVNQAIFEAVTKITWSRAPATYRVIFLVGDAPPQMNYRNDINYAESCRLAAAHDIVINTIQCGNLAQTAPVWQEIARRAGGEYFQVAQSGSAVLYDTPYDGEIAGLSAKLDATRLYYGAPGERAKMTAREADARKIYTEAALSAQAKRTVFNSKKAGSKNFLGHQELVNDVASGKVQIEALDEAELPEELQGRSTAEISARLRELADQRRQLQARINDLGKKRQVFIKDLVQKESDKGVNSLDAKIYRCIQNQAAGKNLEYAGGPEY